MMDNNETNCTSKVVISQWVKHKEKTANVKRLKAMRSSVSQAQQHTRLYLQWKLESTRTCRSLLSSWVNEDGQIKNEDGRWWFWVNKWWANVRLYFLCEWLWISCSSSWTTSDMVGRSWCSWAHMRSSKSTTSDDQTLRSPLIEGLRKSESGSIS